MFSRTRARVRTRSGAIYAPHLGFVIPSCIADWDATNAASYDGLGQLFKNLVDVPYDGATKTAYDLTLGTSLTPTTDDPTFNGSAGAASAYFSNDGGDVFALQGGNTTFLDNLHKTTPTPNWTIAYVHRVGDAAGSFVQFGTHTASTSLGMRINQSSVETFFIQQGDGTSAVSSATATLNIGTDYVSIYSYNGTTLRYWQNSLTKTTTAYPYNAATGAAQSRLLLYRNAPVGSRFYAASLFGEYIDSDKAALIFSEYNKRHGRMYA